jgi:hypothetical protein
MGDWTPKQIAEHYVESSARRGVDARDILTLSRAYLDLLAAGERVREEERERLAKLVSGSFLETLKHYAPEWEPDEQSADFDEGVDALACAVLRALRAGKEPSNG